MILKLPRRPLSHHFCPRLLCMVLALDPKTLYQYGVSWRIPNRPVDSISRSFIPASNLKASLETRPIGLTNSVYSLIKNSQKDLDFGNLLSLDEGIDNSKLSSRITRFGEVYLRINKAFEVQVLSSLGNFCINEVNCRACTANKVDPKALWFILLKSSILLSKNGKSLFLYPVLGTMKYWSFLCLVIVSSTMPPFS